MNYIIILSIIFIIYEAMKTILINTYWNHLLGNTKVIPLRILQTVYMLFIISLYFHTNLWYFGFGITIISFIVASRLAKPIRIKSCINTPIIFYIIMDTLSSVLLLGLIIAQELNLI